jgi:hypothetical protein
VGLAGSCARSTPPSGSTRRLSSGPSCFPGESDTYTGPPDTALAAACIAAWVCLDFHMSQSVKAISPSITELYAQEDRCTVWAARSFG